MPAIQITCGSEWAGDIEWKKPDNSAQDATGATLSAILRRKLTRETIFPIAAVWTDQATGKGRLVMVEDDTALIPLGLLSELVITVVKPGTVTDVFTGGDVEGL